MYRVALLWQAGLAAAAATSAKQQRGALRRGGGSASSSSSPSSPSAPYVSDGFRHAFPRVPLNDDDFLRDENGDNGEWEAQNHYDRMRTELGKRHVQVEVAEHKEAKEQQDMEEVRHREEQAEQEAKAAEAEVAKVKKHLHEAEREVEELAGHPGDEQEGGKIGDSAREVNHEISEVEVCQQRLKEAQARLDHLLAAKAAEQNKLEAARREAREGKAAAEAKYQKAKQVQYDKLDQDLVVQAERARKEHNEAVEAFQKQDAELEALKADVKQAAARLHAARSRNAAAAEQQHDAANAASSSSSPLGRGGGAAAQSRAGGPLSVRAGLTSMVTALFVVGVLDL